MAEPTEPPIEPQAPYLTEAERGIRAAVLGVLLGLVLALLGHGRR